jgi:hypothetical protein
MTAATEEHVYLSTACLHNHHDYCKRERGLAGDKTPAKCKFCAAKCVCGCHKPTQPSITCPQCGATSYNPNDVREGYCGRCNDWTTLKETPDADS